MAYLRKTRTQLMQLIHVGKTQLGMDDDTYRAMLRNVINVDSAKKASWVQLETVLEHMNSLGFKPKAKKRSQPRSTVTQMLKAHWITMAKQGFLDDGSDEALRRWTMRMVRVESPQWLTDMHASRALKSLKQWHKRLMIESMNRPQLSSLSYSDVLAEFERTGGHACHK